VVNDYIHREAGRLIRRFGVQDPFRLAELLGIHVMYDFNFRALKGMYKVIKRSRFIILNGNLSDRDLRTVCAHEIGHDRLHRDLAESGILQEFQLYNMKIRPEYEANIFAADILITDGQILSRAGYDCGIGEIAEELGVDVNLAMIKADELRKMGYDVSAPYRPRSDFLSEG